MSPRDKFFLLVQLAVLTLLPIASLAYGGKESEVAIGNTGKCSINVKPHHSAGSQDSCNLSKPPETNKQLNKSYKKKRSQESLKQSESK
ncbi:MAG: hypothetical protein SFU25_00320 [Candidatus Caenarcaniphilales bacterium]|nr:hypothetical protein [Candidatus Caenarcaniphilales bacterium]